MAEHDTTVPFVLGLIGGIFIILISLLMGLSSAFYGTVIVIWGFFVGIVVVFGSNLMRKPKHVRMGAILTIVFGLLGFSTPLLGIVLGPMLAVSGGALCLSKTGKMPVIKKRGKLISNEPEKQI